MASTPGRIKALIFDFGGVLIRTMSQEPRQRLAARFGLSLGELYNMVFDSEESRLEQLGCLAPGTRWQRVARELGLQSAQELRAFQTEFFSADALDTELVAYLRRMRGRYKTALLSNAWANAADWIRDRLHIDDCFDVIVISAAVHMMKPDPAIYRYTLSQLQVAPQEAVFVDDSAPNVEAAAALGIHGILFTTREAVLEQVEALLQGARSRNEQRDDPQLPAG